MTFAKRFSENRQSAFEERFGGGVIALRIVKQRQIVERCGSVRMLRSECFFGDSQSAFIERFGGGVIALRIVKCRQIVERCGSVRMLRPEYFFGDSQSAFKERFSGGVIALRFVKPRQIVERCGSVRMLRSECFFGDSQRALIEWLGGGVIASRFVKPRQIVERSSRVRVLRSESFFADSQSAFIERFGGGVIALQIVKPRQMVERCGRVGVLRSESFFADSQSAFIERFGGGVIALRVVKRRQIVERCSRVGVLRSESFFVDSQSALIERFGGGVIALRIVKQRQIVERCSRVGVLRSESFFFDSQSALIKRFGGGVIALRFVKRRQIVERCGRVGVLRSEYFFVGGQSAFIERFGGGVIALRIVKKPQQVNRQPGVSVIFAETCFGNFKGFAGDGDSAAIIALLPQFYGFLVKNFPLRIVLRWRDPCLPKRLQAREERVVRSFRLREQRRSVVGIEREIRIRTPNRRRENRQNHKRAQALRQKLEKGHSPNYTHSIFRFSFFSYRITQSRLAFAAPQFQPGVFPMTESACADPRLRPLRTRHARAQEWRYPADCGVDVAAMRAYRLARARRFIVDGGLSAALLFDPLNVRYATDSTNMQVWVMHNLARCAFVPAAGPVVMFDFHTCDFLSNDLGTVDETRFAHSPYYFGGGDNAASHARNLAREVADLLRAGGGKNEMRLGVDTANILVFDALAKEGIEVGYANAAMEHARSIKSDDEIRAMRASLAVCERGMRRMHDALRPGMTEVELWSLLHAENIAGGGEWIECRLLASGPRTNPWFQEASFRPIENGDLVSYDTDMVGPFGYCADLSRALVCGDKPPTAAQKEAYRIAYDKIHFNIDLLRPGMRFEEFARKSFAPPDAFAANRYSAVAHGVGMCDEFPHIPYPQDWDKTGVDGVFAPGMTFCLEAYIGREGGEVGVKMEEQVLVTETGVECLSNFPFEENLLA